MKGKILLMLLFSVMMLASCSSDAPVLMPESDTSILAESNLIGKEMAIDIAGKYRQSMFANTRVLPAVKSIELINSAKTRNGDGEASYYIINYENDGGFAIVDAKPQENPLYAISEEGSVSIKDTVENKGLAMFFRNMEVQSSGIVPVTPSNPSPDTTLHDLVQFPTQTTTAGPYLSSLAASWTQDEPYNYYCPYVNQIARGLVGCVPLSTTQILSYYKWPNTLEGRALDWNTMLKGDTFATYYVMAQLGTPAYYNAIYQVDILAGNIVRLTSVIKDEALFKIVYSKLGYENVSIYPFNAITPRYDLDKGPIQVVGDVTVAGGNGGHAWVMDGYKYIKFRGYADAEGQWSYTTYYHCVWGFGSGCNGYYKWNGHDKVSGDSSSLGTISSEPDWYITNFNPNNQ